LTTPPSAYIASVPFYAQSQYQCGPASLAMTLQWAGAAVNPEQLVSAVYTPGRKGSLQSGLIAAARRHGKLAYPFKGLACLLREVAAGRPVIVLQNLGLKWFPRWHYAVVVGYDLDQHVVVLHTGTRAWRRVGLKTFAHTWKRADDWGLLVLPAGQMPQCAQENRYLNAAFGLQIAGHTQAAINAFDSALRQWPHSADASIALGNALYAQGSTPKAIRAYHRAIQIEPQNADALNNLAHLLAESDALDEAESMAVRAVDLGGPRIDIYRKTLEEIRRQRR
jgi:tetratricopeptide (TPR) repeat protein